MKILDSSALICIFDEIDRPDLMDKISKLGHDIAVPRYVLEKELRRKAKRRIGEMAAAGAVRILENSAKELKGFLKIFPGLGLGESHVMLSYIVLDENSSVCQQFFSHALIYYGIRLHP